MSGPNSAEHPALVQSVQEHPALVPVQDVQRHPDLIPDQSAFLNRPPLMPRKRKNSDETSKPLASIDSPPRKSPRTPVKPVRYPRQEGKATLPLESQNVSPGNSPSKTIDHYRGNEHKSAPGPNVVDERDVKRPKQHQASRLQSCRKLFGSSA
jgi:hypothetical protein